MKCRFVFSRVSIALLLVISRPASPASSDQAGDNEFTIIKKVPAYDCRVVRGFLGTPIDGSVASKDYRGRVAEYPKTASDGIVYAYNNNDGVHITLADGEGFDMVVLRGGAKAKMYVDFDGLLEPKDELPAAVFPGDRGLQIVRFPRRVKAKRVSFFGVRDGALADVGFYRIGKSALANSAQLWKPGQNETMADDDEPAISETEGRFAPGIILPILAQRYNKGDRRTFPLEEGQTAAPALSVRNSHAVHLITPPFRQETGLAVVALDLKISGSNFPCELTAVVHDPLNPALDLSFTRHSIEGPGPIRLVFDIPDQVILEASSLWVTMEFNQNVTLAGPDGGAPHFYMETVPRSEALPEALAWRKFLMRDLYSLLSEPRPWGRYRRGISREEFFASDQYTAQCPELFMTIDQCYALDPNDDLVRQYREWVYLNNLREVSEVEPPPAPPEGVPDWAWYPRLAWLEWRRIAEWWLDERGVPTGEFGGRVGDDSDFYQQFADMPFFETGGVAARMMDHAARMAELAERDTLTGGVNRNYTDALHAYEEGINHLALMARWFYGDPIYVERCMESARNMEHLTIVTKDGRRHFRDRERMGARDMERPSEPKQDGGATPLMWHTSLQAADYNRDPEALRVVREWADSWLRFMKPGQWATEIDVLSGKVTGFSKDRPLYGGYRSQACVFTWLYALTGDARYIEPFMHFYQKGQAPYPSNVFVPDVFALGALNDLDEGTLNRIAYAAPGAAIFIKGETVPLVKAAIGNPRPGSQAVSTLYDARRWPDMFTTSHQFTDRVFPYIHEPASVAYLGGYCHRNKFNPTLAVSWEGFGTDYGALVLVNQRDRMKAAVYSFANKPMAGKMRVWALEHGEYAINVGPARDGYFIADWPPPPVVRELAKADTIDLTLAPKTVTIVEIKQTEKLDPIFGRADLAIAAREIEIDGQTLKGTVHNIGSTDVAEVDVAVIDAKGRAVVRQSLGKLEAPLDLLPRKIDFTLALPGPPQEGWKLLLDPEGRIPEIYEGNNTVALDALPAPDYSKSWP